MFEVGKSYRITTIEGGDETISVCDVVQVDMPLIKVDQPHFKGHIINTHSAMFVGAEPVERDAPPKFDVRIGGLD